MSPPDVTVQSSCVEFRVQNDLLIEQRRREREDARFGFEIMIAPEVPDVRSAGGIWPYTSKISKQ